MQTSLTFLPDLKQVVIWGLSPNSHTHAYIHAAFHKAFHHNHVHAGGLPCIWLPDKPARLNLHRSLFLTVDIASDHIPIHSDSFYVLHNCADDKFKNVKHINIAVFDQEVDQHPKTFATSNPNVYGDAQSRTLTMHWMTDLLPEEIETELGNLVPYGKRKLQAVFIGSINDCPINGNLKQITPFKEACLRAGMKWVGDGMYTRRVVKEKKERQIISSSLLAPAIQGFRQAGPRGYIPCRIFKNISRGHISGTNNPVVARIFPTVPFSTDTSVLFHLMADAVRATDAIEHTIRLMRRVQNEFTYLNLVDYILAFADHCESAKK